MIYLSDADFTLYNCDVFEGLAQLEDESVHCVVTSPPYWGLRDYGTGTWEGGDTECDHVERVGGKQAAEGSNTLGRDSSHPNRDSLPTTGHALIETQFRSECGKCGARRVDNQLGLEPTPEAYIERMVEVFREVRRVLRRDGTLWLNMGDCYASKARGSDAGWEKSRLTNPGTVQKAQAASLRGTGERHRGKSSGLKAKDLVMMPAELAIALRNDGWWLRSEIVWAKPNPMPESVSDRPTSAYEFVYLLTRSPRYFYDQEAVREPALNEGRVIRYDGTQKNCSAGDGVNDMRTRIGSNGAREITVAGRNLRNVWEIPTEPYPDAHFATYPTELVRRCIAAGTSERGCCPECGAPWVRITKQGALVPTDDRNRKTFVQPKYRGDGDADDKGAALADSGFQSGFRRERETIGWAPSCACVHMRKFRGGGMPHPPEPIPCTVFDPFMGSGTTALVARKLGRRCVGIELNPEYCQLAARRTSQLSLLGEDAQATEGTAVSG